MTLNSKLVSKLPTAQEIKKEFPLSEEGKQVVGSARKNISDILVHKSQKKILILGPCSADFQDSLEEYASFIQDARSRYSDKIEIIMRFYTGKPRTVGGWKGISNSKPGDKPDIARGIIDSRSLAITLIEKYKIPLADEMLHPQLLHMFDDIYSYLAIGACSTENQYHREVASGVDFPIGFKNSTSGDIEVMTNSIAAGQTASSYVIGDKIYDSKGNYFSHGILRGGKINGVNYSNYSQHDLLATSQFLVKKGIQNPGFLVDTNHENSNKKYENQIQIMQEVFENIKKLQEKGIDVSEHFKGFMTESYLVDGRQDWPKDNDESKIIKGCSLTDPCRCSLTDPCIGLDKTKLFLEEMYKRC